MTKYTKIVEETFDEEGRLVSKKVTEITENPYTYTYPLVYSSGSVQGSEGFTTWNKPSTGRFET